jgi:hypothetical protein
MENPMLWIVVILAAVTLYRLVSRTMITPKRRVTAMLRHYRALERTGLSEHDCLMQLLATRRDWRRLPHSFLTEVVSRLRSKEDVMRFVSVSEDYRYLRDHYPRIAAKTGMETAMSETACLFATFGFRLQGEGRLGEAEFVQRLALRLQPHQYFTNLPLAATYHETGRHTEALPLFEQGLAQFKELEKSVEPAEAEFSPSKCLGPDAEIGKFRNRYQKMYKACLKAVEKQSLSGLYSLIFMELLG